MITFNEDNQKRNLAELRAREEEDLARILSEKYDLPYVDLFVTSINTDALRLIPENEARESDIVAFNIIGKKIHIALKSPDKEISIASIDKLKKKGYSPILHMSSKRGLNNAIERYKEISYSIKTEPGVLNIKNKEVLPFVETIKNIEDFTTSISKMLEDKKRYKTTRVLELLMSGALKVSASDVHIEPKEGDVKIRLRLDGVLQYLTTINKRVYNLILSRIKLLSGLKINIKKDSQDGRFSIKQGELEIEVRTSVIPGAYGESIVLRVLNPDAIKVDLESLGIETNLLKIINKEIKKPNGMILNTGPTGSGKTTTLYAFLKKISTPQIKIITIEDPIEYHLPNITQTQTNDKSGYTFLEGLRSALRQDPDVIMVGEIRDNETAETAVNAALTGHLVLSTLHTNTASGAIPRLIDLGVNPKVIGASINIIIAQRLVRVLCESCKKEVDPTEEERILLLKLIESLPQKEKPTLSKLWVPGKCSLCNNTGFSGRIGIFEVVLITEEIEKLITQNPSEKEIMRLSVSQGLMNIQQDGIIKVLKGITSMSELERVVEIEEGLIN